MVAGDSDLGGGCGAAEAACENGPGDFGRDSDRGGWRGVCGAVVAAIRINRLRGEELPMVRSAGLADKGPVTAGFAGDCEMD